MILENPIPIVTEKELNFNSIVLYMDLDAFFASVEIREQPKLKGLPIIIGGDPITKRGVVSTCSYEARKFGIHSGMPISQAVKLCPEVRIVKSTHGLYSKVSKNIMKIISYYSPKIKVSGVDEAYLDIIDIVSDYEEAEKLAYELKDDIYASEKITCSIGLAPNKILAKIASGVDKPDGLKIVKPFEIVDFLAPLKISIIPGVGKKSESSFNKDGVYTCGDLK
ncbi:MAG: DNA polymerase IV, partial [Candidatus Heimdallarchaeota archaeon]|nr:DNA polymerase IV [Candidatus Heimdallarchaeota archaeon]